MEEHVEYIGDYPPADPRIKKGVVLSNEFGLLFIAFSRYRRDKEEKSPGGWYGLGFNGVAVRGDRVEYVAANVNEYLQQIDGG